MQSQFIYSDDHELIKIIQSRPIPHFMDIKPIQQFQLLGIAAKSCVSMPLLNYAMRVFAKFRRHIRDTNSPFGETTDANEEYYRIRGSMTYSSLNDKIWKITKALPLSCGEQHIMINLINDVLIQCIDECEWSSDLQKELEMMIDLVKEC